MDRRSTPLLITWILTLLWGTSILTAGAALPDDSKKAGTQTVAQKCLVCHGSYDKIAEATKDFKASSGETTTPHRYIPHEAKPENIPECTECHTPHAQPLKDVSTVIKPKNVDWCYTVCHHQQNLQPCKNCH